MKALSKIPVLSLLKVDEYPFPKGLICDFTEIPRPFHTLALITKGQGDFICGKTIVSVKEGDVIFIPMYSTYMSRWYEESISISIHFQFDIPTPFPYNYKYSIQKIHTLDYDEMKVLFEKICNVYREDSPIQFSAMSSFFDILDKVYPKLSFKKTDYTDDKIEKAVNYIELHYDEDFSIPDLAQLCNMSVSHFHLCIKKQLGCSAIEYKHRIGIHHAELMLINYPQLSIEEISTALGFNSSIYFREIFKKVTGSTPREYRKSVMNSH